MDGIYQVNLKTNGENIEGILEIMGMKHELSNGKVKGNQCYFKGNIKNNAISLQYEIMGQLQNNILNIYAKTNMGEFKLQGKKVG